MNNEVDCLPLYLGLYRRVLGSNTREGASTPEYSSEEPLLPTQLHYGSHVSRNAGEVICSAKDMKLVTFSKGRWRGVKGAKVVVMKCVIIVMIIKVILNNFAFSI